jgi:hypothetical protein
MTGVARTRGETAKSKPAQERRHTALGEMHTKAARNHPRQIDPAPAYHAVLREGWPVANQARHLRLLVRRQPGLGTRRDTVRQSRKTEFVISMDPVAQRLPIHAAQLGRLTPAAPVQH